jgi:acyl-CoA synthetase (AMP-forming)/AMP-acid ligase II
MRPSLPGLRHVIVMGAQPAGALAWQEMLAGDPPPGDSFVRPGLSPRDPMAIFFTGGTTGMPKGVICTSLDFLYPDVTHDKGLTEQDVMLLVPSLFLTAGFITLAPVLLYGMKLVGMPAFDPRVILQTIQDEKVTYMFVYPTMMRMIMGLPTFDQYDVSSVRLIGVGGEPVTTALVEEMQRRFTCQTTTGYGMTEARAITSTPVDAPPELISASDGRPYPGMEVRLIGPDGAPVDAVGEIGEVAVRGPAVFTGYWNRPEVNATVFDSEGWFHTGDLARRINDEGYIRFVGRQKDTIRRGAMNIYPEEVENHLRSHPKIMNAAVIGVPSEVGGERVRAYVQLVPGQEMEAAEVVDHCRGQLASYKLPAEVRLVQQLPLTPQRRVQRFKLRAAALEEER